MPSKNEAHRELRIGEYEYQLSELRHIWRKGTFSRYYVRLQAVC